MVKTGGAIACVVVVELSDSVCCCSCAIGSVRLGRVDDCVSNGLWGTVAVSFVLVLLMMVVVVVVDVLVVVEEVRDGVKGLPAGGN